MLLLASTTVLAAPEALVHQKPTANSLSVNPEIRLLTSVGDEDIESLFQKAKCAECHVIPGTRGANGKVGPRLVMGTVGPKRLKESNYKGTAKTVREYVVESILDHGQYVPRGYRSVPMPLNYNTVLAPEPYTRWSNTFQPLKKVISLPSHLIPATRGNYGTRNNRLPRCVLYFLRVELLLCGPLS